MRREHLPLYAIAAAILVVGLAAAGIDVSTLLVVLIALTCPLMMLFMMTGMDHDGHRQDTPADRAPHGRRHQPPFPRE